MGCKIRGSLVAVMVLLVAFALSGCSGGSSATAEYVNKFTQQTGREIYFTSRVAKEDVEKYSNNSLRGSNKIVSKVYIDKREDTFEIKWIGAKEELMIMPEADLKANFGALAELDSQQIFHGNSVELQFCGNDLKPFFAVKGKAKADASAAAPTAQKQPAVGANVWSFVNMGETWIFRDGDTSLNVTFKGREGDYFQVNVFGSFYDHSLDFKSDMSLYKGNDNKLLGEYRGKSGRMYVTLVPNPQTNSITGSVDFKDLGGTTKRIYGPCEMKQLKSKK